MRPEELRSGRLSHSVEGHRAARQDGVVGQAGDAPILPYDSDFRKVIWRFANRPRNRERSKYVLGYASGGSLGGPFPRTEYVNRALAEDARIFIDKLIQRLIRDRVLFVPPICYV
jgi:hypothetical protein